ncbi:MAG TPA: hypothetical protein VGI78_19030 [Acetobacteraceae bacterium]
MQDTPIAGSGGHDYLPTCKPGFASLRRLPPYQRRERDFRITFGAIISTALGLAFLIARTAHWLQRLSRLARPRIGR